MHKHELIRSRPLSILAATLIPHFTAVAMQDPDRSPPSTAIHAVRPEDVARTIHWFIPEARRGAMVELERGLLASPNPDSLRSLHDMLASHPHIAGTSGQQAVARSTAAYLAGLGLDVEIAEYDVLLAYPIAAAVQIIEPELLDLPIRERAVAEDPHTSHPDLMIGFNAYGASGDVTADVVYANYGRKEDFELLKSWGVDVTGKIVIARYGGNYRGYKARFAQQAGAAGLIIFTDPADSGYVKGLVYPEGGYANESSIQRGSLMTPPFAGDPLTPFDPALPLDHPDTPVRQHAQGIHSIPVQPIGYGAAGEILNRMRGAAVPAGSGWQGGLPCTYRLTGGPGLKVRLMVEQKQEIRRITNVLGVLKGANYPDQRIIIGSHFDSWNCGAADATCGSIVVLETARAFADIARSSGWRPARTLVFANWDAEEFGIIGSSEWVEHHREDLTTNGVAYLNLDMSAMGLDFGASASPLLKRLVVDCARSIQQPLRDSSASTQTVFDAWIARGRDTVCCPEHPLQGNLGGGSDYVGFNCHVLVPSVSFGAGGSPGDAYHSNYDTLAWYRKIVGNGGEGDYLSPLMLARLSGLWAIRLSEGAALGGILPFDPVRYALDTRALLKDLVARGSSLGVFATPDAGSEYPADFLPLLKSVGEFESIARAVMIELEYVVSAGTLTPAQQKAVDAAFMRLERCWLAEQGIPGRRWFRSLYSASDEDSGYAAWMLPGLKWAVENKDLEELQRQIEACIAVFAGLRHEMLVVGDLVAPPDSH